MLYIIFFLCSAQRKKNTQSITWVHLGKIIYHTNVHLTKKFKISNFKKNEIVKEETTAEQQCRDHQGKS